MLEEDQPPEKHAHAHTTDIANINKYLHMSLRMKLGVEKGHPRHIYRCQILGGLGYPSDSLRDPAKSVERFLSAGYSIFRVSENTPNQFYRRALGIFSM